MLCYNMIHSQRPPKMVAPEDGSAAREPKEEAVALLSSSLSMPPSLTSLSTICPRRSMPSRWSFRTWNSAALSSSPRGAESTCRDDDSIVAPLILHAPLHDLP